MWQISVTPAPILLIFGNYESGPQIPCAKCEYSMVNGHPIRGHHNFSTSLTLKATLKNTLKSFFY